MYCFEFLKEEWFWQMIQALGIIVTLALIHKQVRSQTASHVVQSLGAINSRWNAEPMLRARLHVCEQYLKDAGEFDGISEHIAEFMEELGTYVNIKAVPKEIMWEVQSWFVEHYYCIFQSGIHDLRKTYHDETLYENTENLFNVLASLSKRKGITGFDRSGQDLKRFAENEVQIANAFLDLYKTD